MTIKTVVVALGVIVTTLLGSSMTAHAESAQTDAHEAKTEVQTNKVVVVQAGDTLDAIAIANGTTYIRLFNANESIADPNIIYAGDEITIPTADEELPDRFSQLVQAAPLAVAAVPVVSAAPIASASTPAPSPVRTASGSTYTGNGMWCTDYVHSRRPDVPIYGNAGYSWLSAAQASGKATGTLPRAGAIAVMSGHVAYVESVNADGSYVVSEMGWMYTAGNYNIRTVQPGVFGGFIY